MLAALRCYKGFRVQMTLKSIEIVNLRFTNFSNIFVIRSSVQLITQRSRPGIHQSRDMKFSFGSLLLSLFAVSLVSPSSASSSISGSSQGSYISEDSDVSDHHLEESSRSTSISEDAHLSEFVAAFEEKLNFNARESPGKIIYRNTSKYRRVTKRGYGKSGRVNSPLKPRATLASKKTTNAITRKPNSGSITRMVTLKKN